VRYLGVKDRVTTPTHISMHVAAAGSHGPHSWTWASSSPSLTTHAAVLLAVLRFL
jgi:hypothetical protein